LHFLSLNIYSIIAISETWLSELNPDCEFIADLDYSVFRSDRVRCRGGGVAILIKSCINAVVLDECSFCDDFVEGISILISGHDFNFILCCIYRSPSNYVVSDSICELINRLDSFKLPCVLLGDFNFGELNWSLFPNMPDVPNRLTNLVQNCQFSGFIQHVKSPTRNDNILDLVFSNDQSIVSECLVSEPFGDLASFSDHRTVTFNIHTKPNKISSCVVRKDARGKRLNFYKADWEAIMNYFTIIVWPLLFVMCVNVTDFYKIFYEHCMIAIDRYVPLFVRTPRKFIFSKLTNTLFSAYVRLRNRYNNGRKPLSKACMLLAFCSYRNSRRRDINSVEIRRISKSNSKSYWSFIENRLNKRKPIRAVIDKDNITCELPDEKCSAFASFFKSVISGFDRSKPNITSELPFLKSNTKCAVLFTPEMVSNQLRKLKNNCSAGPDKIPNIFLRNLHFILCYPLSTIYNISIGSGQLPDDWLCSRTVPVPKKPRAINVSDFRPISIIPAPVKVMESIIYAKLLTHLLINNFFVKCQFGFLPKKSTEAQLLLCITDWSFLIDAGIAIDLLYFDLKKAFDLVNHEVLLLKLSKLNLSLPLYNWLKAWLSNRRQFVAYDDCNSDYFPADCGVPQGSVLAPLLFLIFINDLPSVIKHCTIKIFADDVKLYLPIKSHSDYVLFNEDIISFFNWCIENRMLVSAHKTELLHLGTNNPNYSYFINGDIINEPEYVRDLGIVITKNLSFKQYIASIVHSATVRCINTRRSFRNNDIKFHLQMYKTFVRPMLEYATCVWSPHIGIEIEDIERVQHLFTKYLPGMMDDSYYVRLRKLGLIPLSDRRLINDLVMMFKIINNLVDLPMIDLGLSFCLTGRGHPYKLNVLGSSANIKRHSFTCRTIFIWNSLSLCTVIAGTVRVFKQRLLLDCNFITQLAESKHA
jgi:hypothetical protein